MRFVALLLLIGACTPSLGNARAEITAELQRQSAAWTRGDLDAFVTSYAEDAQFASPSGLTVGRAEVLARYKKRYGSDASTMGALTLEILDVRASGSGASVLARWKLVWPGKEDKSGLTLLYMEKRPDGWRVVHDASM
jgi:uncharacterized protein (TIGR02246 family)